MHALIRLSPPPTTAILHWPAQIPLAVIARGERPILAIPSEPTHFQNAQHLRTLLDGLDIPAPSPGSTPPVQDLHVGWIGYAMGGAIEPASRVRPIGRLGWVARCLRAWQWTGDDWAWIGAGPPEPLPQANACACGTISPMRSAMGRANYTHAVAAGVELIHAGDVFQVNLAHELVGELEGSPRAVFAALAERAAPVEGMYLEAGGHAICSLSPELFLEIDLATRAVRTEPMKGTRPGTSDPRELEGSAKDAAELAMITDLMRNDLGRVCRFGSIAVEEPRRISAHATGPGRVLQATSVVRGTLRAGITLGELIEASFPPGSVTGAPKIRAMQIIDELEDSPRGPYCGSAFWLRGPRARFNVLIRTLELEGSRASYRVGAGIVADSVPEAEWRETLDKAGVLRAITSIEDAP